MDDDEHTRTAATLSQLGHPGQVAGSPAGRAAEARRAGRALFRPEATAWRRTWQWVTGAAVAALLLVLTFSEGGWTPLLSGVDLFVHEAGHAVTMWAPPLVCSLAGSVAQVALPLCLAAYFWFRRDGLAVVVLVAWAAESLNNVSVYVADAQLMLLPLVGDDGSGAGHDWHNILSRLGLLGSTDLLAGAARGASVCLFVLAFGLAALGYVRAHRV